MTAQNLNNLAEQLAALLIDNDKQLAVAESCTGGWLAKVLTDLSGSSAWFERGFVTYSNQSKHEMLGVREATLETHGAVSQETVEEMSLGTLTNSHADFSISISGIAGPSGGTAEKPVGLVWFSWARKDKTSQHTLASEKHIFKGDRDAVRRQAVAHALTKLITFVEASTD
jgi:nicotinamide-nucleotide amidase